jgi:uncharacterized alpha-E superfamily protein
VISRVAECCFWLLRYVERAECGARLLDVNNDVALDASVRDSQRWKPVVIVMGEQESFEKKLGENAYDNNDLCVEYLTWNDKNPASIYSCLYWARENARTTREVISREMWEVLNTGWQWLNQSGRQAYRSDRSAFYEKVRSLCGEFYGLTYNTLSHGEAFDFMRAGMMLERINQTARVMDVKYHWISRSPTPGRESPMEAAQWVALLRLCCAMEPFFKQQRALATGPTVVEFLLKDTLFPRSVLHCYTALENYLARIDKHTRRTTPSKGHILVKKMVEQLSKSDVNDILQTSLHDQLTSMIDGTAELNACLQREFFDPPMRAALQNQTSAAQSQSQTQSQTQSTAKA